MTRNGQTAVTVLSELPTYEHGSLGKYGGDYGDESGYERNSNCFMTTTQGYNSDALRIIFFFFW